MVTTHNNNLAKIHFTSGIYVNTGLTYIDIAISGMIAGKSIFAINGDYAYRDVYVIGATTAVGYTRVYFSASFSGNVRLCIIYYL